MSWTESEEQNKNLEIERSRDEKCNFIHVFFFTYKKMKFKLNLTKGSINVKINK